jgi:hypothetical protein
VKIENPVFFLSFFGPIVLLPLAAFLHWGQPQFVWLPSLQQQSSLLSVSPSRWDRYKLKEALTE